MSTKTQKVLTLAFVTGLTACSAAAPGSEDVASSGAADSAANKTAYEFFVGKGLTKAQAAGIVGNLLVESAGTMSPTIVQGGGGPGRGIAQWTAGGSDEDRWDGAPNDNVLWYAHKKGESPTSLNLQLAFIWYELTTFSSYGLSSLKASTNVTDATIAFETHFEGCATAECWQSRRISDAEETLNSYESTTTTPPASTCKGGAEAITRAEEWVKAGLKYCQSAYGAPDGDPSCSAICDRESNPAWNAYRSDCSGLVSWAWGLPPTGSGGVTTRDLAPESYAVSNVIPAESLQPGDAINWNDGDEGHVMLFKQWVHPGTEAIFLQEPGCAVYPYHATETTAAVSISGSSIRVPSVIDGAVFTAIRYTGNACDASSTSTNGWTGGSTGGSSPSSCYSETLGRDVANDTCVWSKFDGQLWECTRGDWDLPADNGAPCAATYTGTEGSGGGKECHSDTLRREVPDNACVQSDINSDWYQCANGNWVDRWTDPTACAGVYPLKASANDGDRCYSDTLRREMSDNACVQSSSNDDWYQCDNGNWTDRWTDPAACNGVYPR